MGNSYLAHYGIKGQKHGQRRYQNKDGSLTPEGRIHYGVGKARTKATKAASDAISTAKSAGQTVSKVVSSIPITRSQRRAAKAKRLEERRARMEADNENLRKIKEAKAGIKDAKKDRELAKQGKLKRKKKKLSELSDEELQERMARVEKELKLKAAEAKNNHPTVSAGREFSGKFVNKIFDATAEAIGRGVATAVSVKASSFAKEQLGLSDEEIQYFLTLTNRDYANTLLKQQGKSGQNDKKDDKKDDKK